MKVSKMVSSRKLVGRRGSQAALRNKLQGTSICVHILMAEQYRKSRAFSSWVRVVMSAGRTDGILGEDGPHSRPRWEGHEQSLSWERSWRRKRRKPRHRAGLSLLNHAWGKASWRDKELESPGQAIEWETWQATSPLEVGDDCRGEKSNLPRAQTKMSGRKDQVRHSTCEVV